jgi:FkbM family methyltransferase
LVSRAIPLLGLHGFFRIRRGRYRLFFHHSSLSKRMWADTSYGSNELRLIGSLLDPGDTFVDVGANIGDYTLAAALAVGPQGHGVAFEAHPRTVTYLRENLVLNKVSNVAIGQVAIGDRTGWTTFSDDTGDNLNRITDGSDGLLVPLVPLAPLLPDGVVALVKVDVEGAEKAALDGVSPALDRIKFLYFEVSDANLETFGTSFAALYDLLARNGFSIFQFREMSLREVERTDRFPSARNLLATRDQTALEKRLARLSFG